jgi:GNAT superfamily N-acetyltransferase
MRLGVYSDNRTQEDGKMLTLELAKRVSQTVAALGLRVNLPQGPRFGLGYREELRLRDGMVLRFAVPSPEDREMFIRGFAELSPESRRKRFLGPKNGLTESELDYLTAIDGDRHYAISISAPGIDGGQAAPVGVGRFIRDSDEPEVAEFALTIVDRWQGRGIGRLLLDRLIEAALERGITCFRGHVLSDNLAMLGLLGDRLDAGRYRQDGDVIMVDVPLRPERGSLAFGF